MTDSPCFVTDSAHFVNDSALFVTDSIFAVLVISLSQSIDQLRMCKTENQPESFICLDKVMCPVGVVHYCYELVWTGRT